jgi:hypothetical protein
LLFNSRCLERPDEALGRLAGLRRELYWCLGMRRDAFFEACDALAWRQERVLMLAELRLEPECRRGHGGGYGAARAVGTDVLAIVAGTGDIDEPVPATHSRLQRSQDVIGPSGGAVISRRTLPPKVLTPM